MADEQTGRYARTRSIGRVARSTSFLDERASARRWTRAEIQSRICDAPTFRFGPVPRARLDELASRYQAVTGDPLRTVKQRNMLAACYRVHGEDAIPFIADEFALRGTAQNLLAIVRLTPPRDAGDGQLPAPAPATADLEGHGTPEPPRENSTADHPGLPCPLEQCLPTVIYCEDHRPAFGSAPRRQYDRIPANPDAASYFGDQGKAGGHGSPPPHGTGTA
jgi:hypothetical protein